MFALVADGRNGLRVLQLVSPDTVPGHMGFAPKPNPKLIATFPTAGPAMAVSRGLDRDRVVDESGNQTVVFGRRGARPFTVPEMSRFYRRGGATNGPIYTAPDVTVRDGKLTTLDGASLAEPLPLPPAPPEPREKEVPGNRLTPRGGP
jgi:hypothetical protein